MAATGPAAASPAAAEAPPAALRDGRNLPRPDQLNQEEEEESSDSQQILDSDPVKGLPPLTSLDQRAREGKSSQMARQGAKSRSKLSKTLLRELSDAGVFSSLLPEINASPFKKNDLRALLAWCIEDQPQKPGGLFIGRMRARTYPPRRFYKPACPQCGMHGRHQETCGRRYAYDPYRSA